MGKITTLYKGDMLVESKIGNRSVIIDVPDVMGGSDHGSQPPQLLRLRWEAASAPSSRSTVRKTALRIRG